MIDFANAIDAAYELDKALAQAVANQSHKLTVAQAEAVYALSKQANELLLAIVDTEYKPPAHLDKLQSAEQRQQVNAILRSIHGPVIAAPANLSSQRR